MKQLKSIHLVVLITSFILHNVTTTEGRAWPRFVGNRSFAEIDRFHNSLDSSSVSSTENVSEAEFHAGTVPILQNQQNESMNYTNSTTNSFSLPIIAPQDDNFLETSCNDDFHQGRLRRHPSNCQHYLECDASLKAVVRICGPGTVFNEQHQICDWPQNVPGCENENQKVDVRQRRSLKSEKCNWFGIREHPEWCSKFQQCTASGQLVTHTCGEGTLFNPLTLVCDFQDNVDCGSRKADFGSFGCDDEDNYRAPHPDHCDKFVECDRGTLAIKTCPPATLYQREAEECQHAFRVRCPAKISLRGDFAFEDENKRKRRIVFRNIVKRSAKLNLACEYNYIAPHPANCRKFVECEDGRIFIKSCGPGTAYNPFIGKCDWPHNVRRADSSGDCSRFEQCIGNRFQWRSCRKGEFFDLNDGKCMKGTRYEIEACSRRSEPRTTTEKIEYLRPPDQ